MKKLNSKYLDTKILVESGTQMLQMVSRKFEQMENLQFPVVPQVQPGFLRNQISEYPPMKGESIEEILKDTENKIFPGMTLWNHPNFFAYYPSNITHSAIIAEVFAAAFGTPGFQWICSPAQTELENIVSDWAVHSMELPDKFLMKNKGGGTVASTISDAIFITIHVAKQRKLKQLGIGTDNPLMNKFVGYYGECAHASSIKGLLLKDIHYRRALPVKYDKITENYIIDPEQAKQIIAKDVEDGLIPFWMSTTLGTTPTCGYDPIVELEQICSQYKIWLNVDAAYGGCAFVIPEYRKKVLGLENIDSIQINFAKLMMLGLNGSLFFITDKQELAEAMGSKMDYDFYKNKFTDEHDVWDYKDWQVALGKRFNCLKMWWMMRSCGVEGMREQIMEKVVLAQYFNELVKGSKRFKTFTRSELTLVTFQLHDDNLERQNKLNKQLQAKINENTELGFISGSELQGQFFLRVVIANHTTTKEHLDKFWEHINKLSEQLQ